MNEEERARKAIAAMMVVALITALLLLFSGCKSVQPVVVERVQHDSVFVERLRVDSAYVHDSVYVRDGGDTVFVTKWHTDWRYLFIHDTTSVSRIDSIPYPVEVEKQVRYTPKATKVLAGFGIAFLLSGIVAIVLGTLKFFGKFGV